MTELTPDDAHHRAARVGAVVHLARVRLHTVNVRLMAEPTQDLAVSTAIQAGHAMAGQTLIVRVGYISRAEQGPSDSRQPAWEIQCDWLMDYLLPEGVTFSSEDLDSFALVSGAFSAHPYARELIQRLSGQMGFPPLVLDVLQSPVDEMAAARAR